MSRNNKNVVDEFYNSKCLCGMSFVTKEFAYFQSNQFILLDIEKRV